MSSGLFDVERQEAVSPLRQFYTGQSKEVGLEREGGLREIDKLISMLTGQETEQTRAIKNAIGQLQSGEPSSAIQGALSLIQLSEQQRQNQASNELSRQQLGLKEREINLASQPQQKEQYATIGEGSTIFDLLAGKPVYTAPKTYKDLQGQVGGQNYYNQPSTTPTKPSNRYKFVG